MSRAHRGCPALLLVLAGALAAGGAGAQEGVRASRAVEVEEPGWFKVALTPGEADPRLPARPDLRLFGPGGEEVPYRLVETGRRVAWIPVATAAVRETGAGWAIVFDLGLEPPRHDRLRFDFAPATVAPAVALEASVDGESWETVARADLFRLGEGETLAATTLVYPAGEHRFLRLSWPREAGFPEVADVAVGTVPARSYQLAFASVECPPGVAGESRCRLPLGERGQAVRRLDLSLRGERTVGYRLAVAREGRWEVAAEGLWFGLPGDGERSIDLGGARVAGDALRLDLFGGGEVRPAVAAYEAAFDVQALLFEAAEPGRYLLTWGEGVPPAHPPQPPSSGEAGASGGERAIRERARWVEPGPVEVSSLPPLDLAGVARGGRAPRADFAATFQVLAAGTEPGALFRLEIPAAVYRRAADDLADLRLVTGRRQVPYVRWSPPEPAIAVERADLRPAATAGERTSRFDLTLTESGLPWTAIELSTPARAFTRRVRLLAPGADRPGAPAEPRPLGGWEPWTCGAPPPLPCRLSLAVNGAAPELVLVEFDDGDDAPLPEVDATVWRRRDLLLFLWPAGEAPLQLRAGADGLAAPDYDLEALAGPLLARPWAPAELDLGAAGGGERKAAERWLLVLALVVGGLVLLTLLARTLAGARP